MSAAIPDQWSEMEFEDFATLQRGKDLTRSQFREGTIPVAGSNGVIGYHDTAIAKAPGITVGRSGSVGKVTVYNEDFWPHNTALYVRDFHGNNPHFAGYLLESLNLTRFKTGASVPTLDRNSFKTLPVLVPPLPEQKKIAHILSTVQRTIGAQERLIHSTTELKKALMHKIFTEGLRDEPKKQTEIGHIPESWEVVPLSHVIRSNLQNGAFVKKPEIGQGYLFANVVDMYRESHLDLSRLDRISVHPDSVSQYWLEDGDILVVRSSLKRDGIGQSCVARNLVESVFYDCHLIRVQLEKTKLIPEFLSAFWRSDIGKNDLILRSKTTTMTTINQQGISKALVPIASIAEQAEIIEALEIVDTKIRVHRRQQDSSKNLFRSLLYELMTAKTRVHKASFFGQAINY